MRITAEMLAAKLLEFAKKNAPVRVLTFKRYQRTVYSKTETYAKDVKRGGKVVHKAGDRKVIHNRGRLKTGESRAVGKKGTNMYSPYPGNLKKNGIYAIENGVRFDYDKVGYIGYANKYSHKPRYIEKTVDDFCQYCVSLGGRIIRR